jgi:hypothetical protein
MKNNQLRIGTRVESEHKGTVRFLKTYVKQHKKFPSNKIVFSKIASDHLREDKRYYSKLKKLKL